MADRTWKQIVLTFEDGCTETASIEGDAYISIMEKNDQSVLQNLQQSYKELSGQVIVSVAAAPDTDTLQEDSQSLDEDAGGAEILNSEENQNKDVSAPSENLPNEQGNITVVKKNETITWKHEAVLLLISLYGENKEKFTCSSYKQKDVWKIISTKMFEKGLNYDANQCNEKFRSLKHRHKKITDNNEKSGRGRSTWQYYDAMEELLAGDPAVRPIKVVASSTATPAAESTSTGSSATLTQKPPLPPNVLRTRTPSPVRSISPVESVASDEQVTPVIKRRRKNAEAPEWFQDFVSQNERRLDALEAANSALIEISRERNAILKQLAEALTKK